MNNNGYYISDEFRTNPLSLRPGGSVVKVMYENYFQLYDKIKYPKAYVDKIVSKDPLILAIEVDGQIVWSKI